MNVSWIQRRWWEYRVADQTYLRYLPNFFQFLVVVYALYITETPLLRNLFNSLLVFAVSFFIVYIPTGILIGHFIHRKRQLHIDTSITAKESPWNQDVAQALILLAEGRENEVKGLLKKWLPTHSHRR